MEVQNRTLYVPHSARLDFNNAGPEIELAIVLLSNHPIQLKVNLNNTVEELKEKIRLEIKADESKKITLLYESQIMEDDRTLTSYELTKESVIYQASKNAPERGNKSMGVGFDFAGLEKDDAIKIETLEEGPDYCKIIDGLNLMGTCVTQDCEAYNKGIYIPKGMGTFNIGFDAFLSLCPICKKTAEKVENLGFINCTYTIHGLQDKPERKQVNRTDDADNRFNTFRKDLAVSHWTALSITTQPRKK